MGEELSKSGALQTHGLRRNCVSAAWSGNRESRSAHTWHRFFQASQRETQANGAPTVHCSSFRTALCALPADRRASTSPSTSSARFLPLPPFQHERDPRLRRHRLLIIVALTVRLVVLGRRGRRVVHLGKKGRMRREHGWRDVRLG